MKSRVVKLIYRLAKMCVGLPQSIHVIAICSGGRMVGKYITKYFKMHGIKASYFETWPDLVNKKAYIAKMNFSKSDYIGTVLLAEDAIWRGAAVEEMKEILNVMKHKKVYLATLLDLNKKADFSIFN